VAEFEPGDVVVLKSGSMRMLVERIDDKGVAVVWANDGGIGRDVLPVFALNKWEDRGPREDRPFTPRPPRAGGDDKPRFGGGDKPRFGGGGKPPFGGGDRKPGGGKPFSPRPAGGKPGMDGKPRAKNFFRKDE
jgi:uncharacterized protein YodC (DUF2158 family)